MTDDLRTRPVVVVPVHRAVPLPSEIVSLRHCGKVLSKRDIVILAPKHLDLGIYRELLPSAADLRVEPHWMASYEAYNRMMVSPLVFNALAGGYTHMMVHEPDAIVIRDEIDYWCNQPFDYVGAPALEGWGQADAPVIRFGNFGFSLHRLSTSTRIINSSLRWQPIYTAVVENLIRGLRGDKAALRQGLIRLGSAGRLRGAYKIFDGYCDGFWCFIVPTIDKTFRIPPADVAIHFAWDAAPSRYMELCGGRLPFGIHAWFKWDLAFLTPHLLSAGVDLREVLIADEVNRVRN